MTAELRGVYIVLVTPLDEKRLLDSKSLEALLEYYNEAGVDGFTALGEVSESDRLSERERIDVISTIKNKLKGELPLVIGVSRESTQLAIEASRWAEGLGATAIMVAPPKNIKLRDEAIFNHFAAVGDAVRIPIIVQDEPESNHPYMSVQLLARINNEISRARYVKLEDQPTPTKIMRLNQLTNNKMKIFGASHGKGYLWELDRGAVGIMTASPTPEYLVEIWRAYQSGERNKAKEIFFYNLPLVHFYSEMALAVKKEVLVKRGIIGTAKLKQPSAELGDSERKDLFELLEWVEANVQRTTRIPSMIRS